MRTMRRPSESQATRRPLRSKSRPLVPAPLRQTCGLPSRSSWWMLPSAPLERMPSLGCRPPEAVRAADVPDALVDTGASTLSVPRRLVAQLGLKPLRSREAPTSAGPVTLQVYGTVRLTVQGRDCTCDVVEIPDDCPV